MILIKENLTKTQWVMSYIALKWGHSWKDRIQRQKDRRNIKIIRKFQRYARRVKKGLETWYTVGREYSADDLDFMIFHLQGTRISSYTVGLVQGLFNFNMHYTKEKEDAMLKYLRQCAINARRMETRRRNRGLA